MEEKERLVNFTLLGQDYSFYTGTSEEEMAKILDLVRRLTEEGKNTSTGGTIPVSKIAVMACLNIASRYIKLQQEFAEFREKNDSRAAELIEKIDATLVSEKRIK